MKLIADMHTHTIASDHAYSTINENCASAERNGVKALAITDHAPAMPDSPHIWHFHNLSCLPRKINGVVVLKGVEANVISYDGELDMTADDLRRLEWVVASMHKYCVLPTTAEEITRGYLNMANNPLIDVIGHCTTDYFPFDYEVGIKAFKEYGKLVEINESSIINKKGSAKNSVEVLRLCKKYDCPVIVNTDAHYCEQIGNAPNALKILEEVGFPEQLVINTEWEKLREFILKTRPSLDL